ncbi:hypothetical protein T4B_1350 [Trichinella pseudospiralis]|uniref:Uncharacterized protein n=1 Tax=Trichinella pseudospiralis TaxID=6337 RepID=A0A0V1IIC2_TRIPS|nr:hypothetical protein T4B_1350 [Trichinella pseudospiralis]
MLHKMQMFANWTRQTEENVFFVAVALVAQLTSQEDAYDEEQHQDEHNTLHEDVQAQSIQVSTTDVVNQNQLSETPN